MGGNDRAFIRQWMERRKRGGNVLVDLNLRSAGRDLLARRRIFHNLLFHWCSLACTGPFAVVLLSRVHSR